MALSSEDALARITTYEVIALAGETLATLGGDLGAARRAATAFGCMAGASYFRHSDPADRDEADGEAMNEWRMVGLFLTSTHRDVVALRRPMTLPSRA